MNIQHTPRWPEGTITSDVYILGIDGWDFYKGNFGDPSVGGGMSNHLFALHKPPDKPLLLWTGATIGNDPEALIPPPEYIEYATAYHNLQS